MSGPLLARIADLTPEQAAQVAADVVVSLRPAAVLAALAAAHPEAVDAAITRVAGA